MPLTNLSLGAYGALGCPFCGHHQDIGTVAEVITCQKCNSEFGLMRQSWADRVCQMIKEEDAKLPWRQRIFRKVKRKLKSAFS